MYVFVESSFNMFKLPLGFDLILFFYKSNCIKGKNTEYEGYTPRNTKACYLDLTPYLPNSRS